MKNAFLFVVCEELTMKRTHIIFSNAGFARCVKRELLFVALVMRVVSVLLVVAGGLGGLCAGSGRPGVPVPAAGVLQGIPPAEQVSSCDF